MDDCQFGIIDGVTNRLINSLKDSISELFWEFSERWPNKAFQQTGASGNESSHKRLPCWVLCSNG